MTEPRQPVAIEDLYRLGWVEDPRISPDGRWIAFVRVTVDRVENGYQRHLWIVPADGSAPPRRLTYAGKQNHTPRWSPDGRFLAFVSDRTQKKPQIHILPWAEGGEAWPLTRHPNGATAPEWSPDGRRIAFLARVNAEEREKEDRGEEEPPPQDAWEAKRREEERKHREELRFDPREIRRFPYRTGTEYLDDRYTQIYVVEVPERPEALEKPPKPRRLTGEDRDFSPPRWTPDGRYLLTTAKRDPEDGVAWFFTDLYRIPVEGGAPEALTGPGHSYFDPRPSPDGRWIAVLRLPEDRPLARAARLALLPADGGEVRDLVTDLEVYEARWGADGLVARIGREGRTWLYGVGLEGGEPIPLLEGDRFVQAFDVGPAGELAFAQAVDGVPSDLFATTPAGEEVRLTEVNPWIRERALGQVHELWYTAPDGRRIQGWYLTPPDFDPQNTYPLAVEVHGGPHVMWSPWERTMWHEFQVLAGRGFVVFFCNPRGSAGYGDDFQDAIHGRWGEADAPDILAGIDALVAKGFIDPQKICVTGGSYGGFMTAWLVGHDDRFAAAVSQRGVYNLVSFYGVTDVPELIEWEFDGRPWEIHDRLWRHSPLAYAHRIQTPLLILHAERDFRVPIADAEQLYLYLRRLKREVAFVRYPRDGHELSRTGEPRHREDRLRRIVEWFEGHIGRTSEEVSAGQG